MGTQPEALQDNSAAPTSPAAADDPKPSVRDWLRSATVVLIALNVLMFLIMVVRGVSAFAPTADQVLRWGADYGPLTLNGQWWRMLASTFLHFGIIHLLFNMYVLFNIGLFLESLTGRVSYLVLYLVCGLGGSAASLAWHPSIVSAGASGAIFGLYGALLGFLLRHRGSIPAESLASLRKGAFTFIGYNLLFGLRPGVDMAAHLGGLATGFVLGLFLIERPTVSSSPVSPEGLSATFSGRVALAVALGLALIAVPMIALPKPDDYLAEYERLAATEDKVLNLFNSAEKQWRETQMSGQQFADILDQQVLAPWRAEREAMEKLKVSKDQAATTKLLVEYMNDREQGWQLTIDGLRNHDTDKLKQGAEKEAEAERAVGKLGGR